MNHSFPTLSSSPLLPRTHSECIHCKTLIEFELPGPSHSELQSVWSSLPPEKLSPDPVFPLKCWKCQGLMWINKHGHIQPRSSSFHQHQDGNGKPLFRNPLASPNMKPPSTSSNEKSFHSSKNTEYYDLLNVSPNATQEEIRKSYYALAIRYHPDKCPDDPNAEALFKKISEAYQILSDPKLRKNYDEFGSISPEGGFMDPIFIFRQQFGGDSFVNIIGDISIAFELQDLIHRENDASLTSEEKSKKTQVMTDARKKKQEERVKKLADYLLRKLSIWTESDRSEPFMENFKEIITLEANELKKESFGVELLHAVGYTYSTRAKQYLGGLGGYWHSFTEKTHIVSDAVSAVKSAIRMKKSIHTLADAEKKGITTEEKMKLEEETLVKGLETLWKTSKLEVESALRDVCDAILGDPNVSKDVLYNRAIALQTVGTIYLNVKP